MDAAETLAYMAKTEKLRQENVRLMNLINEHPDRKEIWQGLMKLFATILKDFGDEGEPAFTGFAKRQYTKLNEYLYSKLTT